MSAHDLLLWMSARRAGSWQQFRSAVEALHLAEDLLGGTDGEDDGSRGGLPIYQQYRLAFERLGHAEFFAGGRENGWRVAAPALALSESNSGLNGILCGARSPRLLAAIEAAAVGRGISLHTEDSPHTPPIIRVAGTREAIAGFAAIAGVAVQADAPLAILGCLSTVNDVRHLHRAVLPMGADWRVDRFDSRTLGWRASSRDEAALGRTGLFRFVASYERYHFLRMGGELSKVPGQIGKYLILRSRRRSVLRYDSATGELTAPASCRPPILVERALTLCTGSLATYEAEGALLRYRGIPAGIARIAGQLLCQEI